MTLTKDNIFLDSNILIYLFDEELHKKEILFKLFSFKPKISSQVIIEFLNVSIRKLKISNSICLKSAEWLMQLCDLTIIDSEILKKSFFIAQKHKFSHLDCLIIATALGNNCNNLYSEDLQHNQIIENKLKILNPFHPESQIQ